MLSTVSDSFRRFGYIRGHNRQPFLPFKTHYSGWERKLTEINIVKQYTVEYVQR